MTSQRRAPTKRPPRPAAKKPTPPDGPEGVAAAANATATSAGGRGTKSGGPAKTERVTKTATPGASPASGSGAAPKVNPAAALKSNTGGPNYRPPSGAARKSRSSPPPRPKKKRLNGRTIGALIGLVTICSLVIFFSIAVNGSTSNPSVNNQLSGPEQVPVPKGPTLAAVDSARYPSEIDGVKCQATEQVAYHIHAHLAIFVDGQARQVPYSIGIAPPLHFGTNNGTFVNGGSCFYWLHTHAADGILHIESPTTTIYTLGQAFDLWGQPLKADQVGPAVGTLKAYVNGKPYTGDVRAIPLNAHDQIQLDVGSPAPAPVSVSFPNGM